MTRVRLSVDIDPALKHQLAVCAAVQGRTISEIVVEAVQRIVREKNGPEGESLAGALSAYADSARRDLENDAWPRAVAERTDALR
jgi:metal-responsive CopG/Arc/MetJ family transcriptional regulator